MRSVALVAYANNYDGWMMLSLYPRCTASTRCLHDECDEEAVAENLVRVRNIFGRYPGAEVWAAWGIGIKHKPYFKNCLDKFAEVVDECGCEWITFGENGWTGHPRHPLHMHTLRLKKRLDMAAYRKSFKYLNNARAVAGRAAIPL